MKPITFESLSHYCDKTYDLDFTDRDNPLKYRRYKHLIRVYEDGRIVLRPEALYGDTVARRNLFDFTRIYIISPRSASGFRWHGPNGERIPKEQFRKRTLLVVDFEHTVAVNLESDYKGRAPYYPDCNSAPKSYTPIVTYQFHQKGVDAWLERNKSALELCRVTLELSGKKPLFYHSNSILHALHMEQDTLLETDIDIDALSIADRILLGDLYRLEVLRPHLLDITKSETNYDHISFTYGD